MVTESVRSIIMLMNLDEFIAKWTEKKCDWDGAFGSQCFDLYRYYCQDVLAIPQSPATGELGAVAIWDNYLTDYLDKTENTPTGVPQPGDIVIWGTKIGKYGHVAIFTEGTSTKFKSFDCNFPTGSLPHVQDHTYAGVLGWLRKKALPPQSLDAKRTLEFVTENRTGGNLEGTVREWLVSFQSNSDLTSKANRLQALIDNLSQTWALPSGSDEAEILTEAKSLLLSEDTRQKYRDAIEEVVGDFNDDLSLLVALSAVQGEIKRLSNELSFCQQKLSKSKVIFTFRLLGKIVKVTEG